MSETELLTIFEEAEQKIKRTVNGSTDPTLAATLVLYAATLFESSIKAISSEEGNLDRMTCGVLRQTIRKTVGLDTFMSMMNDESMVSLDKIIDFADENEKGDDKGIYG